ncbi:hypothetical protein CGSMWGv55152_05983 [Gardnerella vaginalis 55152]|uniref:Uncharacterized protein n=2 Tax=Gardnerella vaginalis TaxID=2702 RepID=I4LPQ7_GARVA|nr:hypothetical protein CGSMWGv55152_05983 [Gardnerella vaginalis 55152]EIK82263.1 hypothetical protein CGSMWGv1400E_00225 [Gardnerella vaginalis 1400E]
MPVAIKCKIAAIGYFVVTANLGLVILRFDDFGFCLRI